MTLQCCSLGTEADFCLQTDEMKANTTNKAKNISAIVWLVYHLIQHGPKTSNNFDVKALFRKRAVLGHELV